MQNPKFKFYSFKEWKNNNYYFCQRIGNYYCTIEFLGSENGGGYQIVYYSATITYSTGKEPFTIAKRVFSWNERDQEVLCEWYNDATKALNREWEKFQQKIAVEA